MGSVLKALIRALSLCFMLIVLAILMVSMMTHHWREADGVNPLGMKLEFNHGLWTQCGKVTRTVTVNNTTTTMVLGDECTRIKSSQVSGERETRGRATRILIGTCIIGVFLSFGLAFVNVFNMKENIHRMTQFGIAVLLFLSFLTGIAGMANFTDYFDGEDLSYAGFPPLPYSFAYSWRLGWVGTVLIIIPFFLSLLDGITYTKN